MNIEEHHTEFQNIIKKYKLDVPAKAEEIAHFLTTHKSALEKDKDSPGSSVTSKEFASLFNMEEKEAVLFLSFIERGLKFKKATQNNHL